MLSRRRHEGGPVRVPAEVARGIEAVRHSGLCNMLDRPVVIDLARMLGHEATAEWIEANKTAYAELVFHGLVVDEGDSHATYYANGG